MRAKITPGILATVVWLSVEAPLYAANGLAFADIQTETDQVRSDFDNTNLAGSSRTGRREIKLDGGGSARPQVPANLNDCSQAASTYLECIGPEHWDSPIAGAVTGAK